MSPSLIEQSRGKDGVPGQPMSAKVKPIYLHALWLPQSYVMAFWLEDSSVTAAGNRLTLHPASMPLRKRRLFHDDLDLYEERRTIAVPTCDNRPLTSHGQINEAYRLQAWTVFTAETIADCVIDYLLQPNLRDELDGRPLRCGPSLRYWQVLAEYATRLIATERIMPGVARLDGKCYPVWQSVFSRDCEAEWLRLARAMPPVCASAAALESDTVVDHNPEAVPLSFIDACVDYLVRRRRLAKNPQYHRPPKTRPPLQRQWLDALEAGRFQWLEADDRALGNFSSAVSLWNDPLRPVHAHSPHRLGFELLPPETQDGDWEVACLLVPIRNPAASLPAAEVLSGAATPPELTPRAAASLVLRALGQAVQLFPPLAEALADQQLEVVRLTCAASLHFLAEVAPLLKQYGFVVRLPTWWEEPQQKLGLRLRISPRTAAGQDRQSLLGLDELVGYQWQVALGDDVIDEQEFRQLAAAKSGLVFRQGQWQRLDVEALRKSVASLDAKGIAGEAQLNKAIRDGFAIEGSGGLPVIDLTFDRDFSGPVADFGDGFRFEHIDPPAGLEGTLRPYQRVGYSWMAFLAQLGLGACLADDMGLGKTIQMIALMLHDKESGRATSPCLVVCPMSVVGNWTKEINRFAPSLRVMIHHGGDRSGQRAFLKAVQQQDVIITTYNLAVRDQTCLLACDWWSVVLDEAQNIKNPSTKQSTALRSLKARQRFCLTGTPVENRLIELWSLMEFLNPGYLGRLNSFRSSFAIPIEREGCQTRASILRKIAQPFILRRLKSDKSVIADLPQKQEMKVFCNLTSEQAALYQAVVDEMFGRIGEYDSRQRRGVVLSVLVKLKQITNHPVNFLRDASDFDASRSGKLQRLLEMLEVVLEAEEKALIFTQFTQIGDRLQTKLQQTFGVPVLYLHGGTTQKERDRLVQQFQTKAGPPLFLLSLKAGGLGLNLTEANHVFHFDRWWNPAVENQATDRAYRIGQDRNVQVHKFICVGTVEERIDRMIDEKSRLASDIISAGEHLITDLSVDELRETFTLSRDAISEF